MPEKLDRLQRNFVALCYDHFFPSDIHDLFTLMYFKYLIYALFVTVDTQLDESFVINVS